MEIKCRRVKKGVMIDVGNLGNFLYFSRSSKKFYSTPKKRRLRKRGHRASAYMFSKENFRVVLPDHIGKVFHYIIIVGQPTTYMLKSAIISLNRWFSELPIIEQELFIIRIEEAEKKQ